MGDTVVTSAPAGNAPTDTSNKATVAARYLGSNVFGALTMLAVLGGLPADKAQALTTNLHAALDSLQQAVGALSNIWYIVFPILSLYLGKLGVNSAGFGAMVDKILTAAKAGNLDASVKLITAAAAPELGTKAIINPALAPNAATPANVVISTDAAKAVIAPH